MRAGRYGGSGQTTAVRRSGRARAPIVVKGYPGDRRPVVRGQFRVFADNVKVSRMTFDGPTGRIARGTANSRNREDVQVWIFGNGVALERSEVRNNGWHAGIYVYRSENVRIQRNYIHHNGQFNRPAMANLDHGIYFDSGSGLVANNLFVDNVAHAVQLYTEPHDVRVVHNTMVGHGRSAVIVAGAARRNVIANNLITDNREGIRTFELVGPGNQMTNNLLWNNIFDIAAEVKGLALGRNLLRSPRVSERTGYRLPAGSPAIDRGLPAYGVSRDYLGRRRSGRPDLGAFEYRPD
ncbi:MAG TPA: right-handed parallel beta-helix repeat-containing protein [Thermoleophilaceae bacterium]|nr:right-handed parallel beta-helix repeat-containing protein [Thermoleophilaceae bacterium]